MYWNRYWTLFGVGLKYTPSVDYLSTGYQTPRPLLKMVE